MIYDVDVTLEYGLDAPADMLLQIEVPDFPDQSVTNANIDAGSPEHFARVVAEDGIGDRIWLRCTDGFACTYHARVDVQRPTPDIADIGAVPPHLLPPETVRYLLPSRYVPVNRFQALVADEFGDLGGGARIIAIRDWINAHVTYAPGSSTAETTAADTYLQRRGICRDFAHVVVAMARSSAIPARFVSCYAPGVTPQDFHAVAEVYLEGGWHLVDATGMAGAGDIARIGVGADAAEVSFLTIFGAATLQTQTVDVTPVS